jgi:hypothetical protein
MRWVRLQRQMKGFLLGRRRRGLFVPLRALASVKGTFECSVRVTCSRSEAQGASVPEALVRKRLHELLDTCRATNTRPSVPMLARQLDWPTPPSAFATPRSPTRSPSTAPPRRARERARRNRDLTTQLALAAAHVQLLALHNESPPGSLEGGIERHEHQQPTTSSLNQEHQDRVFDRGRRQDRSTERSVLCVRSVRRHRPRPPTAVTDAQGDQRLRKSTSPRTRQGRAWSPNARGGGSALCDRRSA